MDTQTDSAPAVLLDIERLAERIGVRTETARTYHKRAERHRREHNPLPGDLPEPDERLGGSPIWYAQTINAWLERRPGQGHGGGRQRPEDAGSDG